MINDQRAECAELFGYRGGRLVMLAAFRDRREARFAAQLMADASGVGHRVYVAGMDGARAGAVYIHEPQEKKGANRT